MLRAFSWNKKKKLFMFLDLLNKRREFTKLVGTFLQVFFSSIPPKPNAVFYLINYDLL